MLSLSCVLRLFILIAVWLYLIIVMISVIPRAGFSQSSAMFQMCIMCHQPSPSLPFCSSPTLLLLTVAKLPSWSKLEDRASASWVWGRALATVTFCCIVCSQNTSGWDISCSLVSITMSGKLKANPGSGRIWNLFITYQMAAALWSAALYGHTSWTCLRQPWWFQFGCSHVFYLVSLPLRSVCQKRQFSCLPSILRCWWLDNWLNS